MTKSNRKSQHGASLIHWIIALVPLLAVGALAVDLSNVLVSNTELQNAADAGALEGTRQLYNDDGTLNLDVGQCDGTLGSPCDCGSFSPSDPACDAANANNSQGTAVEVVSTRRGHWTFVTSPNPDVNGIERGGFFTANTNTGTAPTWDAANGDFRPLIDAILPDPTVVDCSGDSPDSNMATDVNRDTCDFNAVQVCVARSETPVAAFFARLVGIPNFETAACAVAYVGFVGNINPGKLDAPIAVCEHLLKQNGEYNCHIGRWNTSSSGDEGAAKWTDFDQSHCNAAQWVGDLIDAMSCGGDTGINTDTLDIKTPINVIGTGVVQSKLTTLFNKWKTCNTSRTCKNGSTSAFPTQPWTLRLPVVDCDDATNSSCNPLVGAVEVQVIWENNQQSDSGYPTCMEGVQDFPDWYANGLNNRNRWNDPIKVPPSSRQIYPPGATGNAIIYDSADNKKTYDLEEQVWDSFVRHFKLSRSTTQDCSNATDDCGWWKGDIKQPFADKDSGYRDKALYFAPSCTGQEIGGTGGTVTFLRAEVPVLVY